MMSISPSSIGSGGPIRLSAGISIEAAFTTVLPTSNTKDCGHEYLFAVSCKRRHFCSSCHQKCVVEEGIYQR
jgi:hypothetical protein